MSITVFYLLVFLTPFIVGRATNEIFEFPKTFFVYFLGTLLILLSVVDHAVTDGKQGWAKQSSVVSLFAFSFILSSFFSSHHYTSLWGYFSRFNGGLISILIFYGIYSCALYLKPNLLSLLKIVALTMVPVSLYSILQHYGLGGQWVLDTRIRAFSTLGQPNWLAAYGAVVIPIVLYLLIHSENIKNKAGWYILAFLAFCGFWFAYSISGIIGLAVSTSAFVVLNLKEIKRNVRILLLLVIICGIFAILNPGIFVNRVKDSYTVITNINESETKSENPAPNDNTKYQISDSGYIRKYIWTGTIKLWLSSPKTILVGTGPETFPYEFQPYRPAPLNYSSEWNYILNKPHNYYLELLAQNGLTGLVIYLIIIFLVLKSRHPVVTPALTGLFITNFFGWPTVSTSLLFWVLLSYLFFNKGASAKAVSTPLFLKFFGISFLILGYIWINSYFVKYYLADSFSKLENDYFERGDTKNAQWFSNRSVELNPLEPFYYRQRAKIMTITDADRQTIFRDLKTAVALNPRNLATLRGEVPLYYYLSLKNLRNTSLNPEYLPAAQKYLTDLENMYPDDAGVAVLVAKYQKLLGLNEDYNKSVESVRKLRPDLLDWYLK